MTHHLLKPATKLIVVLSLTAPFTACDARQETPRQRDAFAYNEAGGKLQGPTNGARCTVFGGFADRLCVYTLSELASKPNAKRLPVLTEGNLRVYNGHLVVCPDEPHSSPVFMLDIKDDLRAQDIAVMIGRRVVIAGYFDGSGQTWSKNQHAGLIEVGSLRWL